MEYLLDIRYPLPHPYTDFIVTWSGPSKNDGTDDIRIGGIWVYTSDA